MAADPDPFESMAKLVELERWHDALPLIEKQLKDNPKDPRGHVLLGQIYFWLSDFDKCKEHFALCVSADADYFESTAGSFLARLAYWQGDYDEARSQIGKAETDNQANQGLRSVLDLEGVQRKQTAHYQVYVEDDLAKQGGLKYAAAILEDVHKFYSKMFPLKTEKMLAPVVIVSDRERFEELFEKFTGQAPHPSLGGVCDSETRVILLHNNAGSSEVVAGGFTDLSSRLLYQLSFSQFRMALSPYVVPWFEYGLSLYVAESEFKKGKPKFGTYRTTVPDGKTISVYERAKSAAQDRQFLPLSTLLTMDFDEFVDLKTGRVVFNQAQAWSLIHCLLHSKKYRKGKKLLVRYFIAIHAGKTPQEAYAKTFGSANMGKLEKAWSRFLGDM